MERGPTSEDTSRRVRHWTLLLVPDNDRVALHQRRLDVRAVRVGVVAAVGLLACGVAALSQLSFGGADRAELVSENLLLRQRLQEIESQLDQADATLQRVQLYDAQLRDMVRDNPIRPGSGPVDAGEGTASESLDYDEEHAGNTQVEDELPALAEDLRPAEAWATEVQARTDEYVARLEALEPRLGLLAEDMEDLMSIQAAFPQVWPAEGTFTSGFGYRQSPINNVRKFHSGVDIAAPRGTRVVACASGVVIMADYNSGYGRMVEIDHGYGIVSRYAHNSSVFVRRGDWVDAGQPISTIGTTGQTTGPHLHFELMIDGQQVDPLEYLPH
ncbi:MAG: M23 family metallopeptidase [Myxococcota bacterium]|nr:M23 family metallopeptidase [Myxococcota bacterium]